MSLDPHVPPQGDDDSPLLIVRFDEIHEPAGRASGRDSGTLSLNDGVASRALTRASVVMALEGLRTGDVAVERVQVVRALDASPEYVLQEWTCENAPGETTAAWARRSVPLAEEFVAEWPDPGDGTVRYLLTTSGHEDRRAA